jgi:hypothetical protein
MPLLKTRLGDVHVTHATLHRGEAETAARRATMQKVVDEEFAKMQEAQLRKRHHRAYEPTEAERRREALEAEAEHRRMQHERHIELSRELRERRGEQQAGRRHTEALASLAKIEAALASNRTAPERHREVLHSLAGIEAALASTRTAGQHAEALRSLEHLAATPAPAPAPETLEHEEESPFSTPVRPTPPRRSPTKSEMRNETLRLGLLRRLQNERRAVTFLSDREFSALNASGQRAYLTAQFASHHT